MSPNLIALDTSTPRAALAAIRAGVLAHVATPDPDARHGRALLPAVRDLLEAAGLPISELDGLVVGLGPGSYTGLRVGVTAAKTLAYALGKPLAALDSLAVIARAAPDDALCVSIVGDAQRGDLYVADFTRPDLGAPLVSVAPTRIVSVDDWAAALPHGSYVAGPALHVPRLAGVAPSHARRFSNPDDDWPNPVHLAALALDVWRSGLRADLAPLEPAYLRRSAAEDQWERKARSLAKPPTP